MQFRIALFHSAIYTNTTMYEHLRANNKVAQLHHGYQQMQQAPNDVENLLGHQMAQHEREKGSEQGHGKHTKGIGGQV